MPTNGARTRGGQRFAFAHPNLFREPGDFMTELAACSALTLNAGVFDWQQRTLFSAQSWIFGF